MFGFGIEANLQLAEKLVDFPRASSKINALFGIDFQGLSLG